MICLDIPGCLGIGLDVMVVTTFLKYINNQDTISKQMRHSPRQTITMLGDCLRISFQSTKCTRLSHFSTLLEVRTKR